VSRSDAFLLAMSANAGPNVTSSSSGGKKEARAAHGAARATQPHASCCPRWAPMSLRLHAVGLWEHFSTASARSGAQPDHGATSTAPSTPALRPTRRRAAATASHLRPIPVPPLPHAHISTAGSTQKARQLPATRAAAHPSALCLTQAECTGMPGPALSATHACQSPDPSVQ